MGASWATATDHRIRLTVFAGTIPSESSAIARMSIDGLQAAMLMIAGLSEIDPSFNVLGIPFFFESDEELLHVQQKLTPMLSRRLEAKGFHLLSWGNAGWIQIFSKKPIRTVADLQRAKLYTTQGDPEMAQWYTANGFHAVPLATGEIPKQLKLPTGAIDAAPSPPVFALALQFFRDAPYMLDVRVVPLIGATIITDTAWNKVSPEDRVRMIAAAGVMEKQLFAQAPGLDQKSIAEMKSAGLTVITLDAAGAAQFRAAAERLTTTPSGMVPPEVFDLAVRERESFRRSRAAR
jgi:TRAP-type C4-dicarboxylate transport system substrate-binding protein